MQELLKATKASSPLATSRETDEIVANIGARIRARREQQQLSLRDLAQRSGVSTSAVQKTEAGLMTPTIGVLMKIARGLRCKLTDFLEEDGQEEKLTVTRKRARKEVSWNRGQVRAHYLAGELVRPELLMFEIHLEPGASSGAELLSHGGEEIVLCLKGEVEFRVEAETVRLRQGDCLHFKSGLPHQWANPGPKRAQMLLVCTAAGAKKALPWQ